MMEGPAWTRTPHAVLCELHKSVTSEDKVRATRVPNAAYLGLSLPAKIATHPCQLSQHNRVRRATLVSPLVSQRGHTTFSCRDNQQNSLRHVGTVWCLGRMYP